MSRLILRPIGQQHAAGVEIVGFQSGLFRTRDGKRVMVLPSEKLHLVG